MSDFYRYFSENMATMHLSAPQSLFGSAKQAKETIGSIIGAIRAFGTTATLSEILGTIPSLSAAGDLFTLGGAITASFYVGACIGSVAIATQRSLTGGAQIIDFFSVGKEITDDNHVLTHARYEYVRAGGKL